MALTRMPTYVGGGGASDGYVFTFETSELVALTDANPLVVRGNFSNIKSASIVGYYADRTGSYGHNTAASFRNDIASNLNTGTWITWNVATAVGTTVWRHIRFYSDRIEIGQGGYGTTLNSDCAYIKMLAVADVTIETT